MTIADRATRTMAARFVWGGLTLVFLLGLFLIRSAASPWAAPSRLLLVLTVACAVLFILSMVRHPITASERAALAVTAPAPSPIPAAEPMPTPSSMRSCRPLGSSYARRRRRLPSSRLATGRGGDRIGVGRRRCG